MLTPHKFPSEVEIGHVSNLRKYKYLYELKHKSVLGLHEKIEREYKKEKDIVYISHALPAMISDFYGDFVQGDETRLQITTNDEESKKLYEEIVFENDLIEKVYDMGVEQSEYGYTILHIYENDDGKIIMDLVPHDSYFPQKDGSVVIATYKQQDGFIDKEFAVLTQHYQVEGTGVKIERKAWKANQQGVIYEEIPLTEMEKIMKTELLPESRIENLDVVPFVVAHNGRKLSNGYGKSDFFDILPNLAEVNERATQISTQFLKNLSARLILPPASGLTDDDGNPVDWDTLVIEGKDNITPQFLTVNNPLIGETMDFIQFQLRIISQITAVPLFDLIKGSQPERVESMHIHLFGAIRKTNTKRAKIKRALKDAMRIAQKIRGVYKEDDAIIDMSDVLPVDDLAEAQTEQIKIGAGLSSRKSSIMRLSNMSEEEAEEEIERIKEEDTVAGVVGDENNAPAI